MTRGVRCAWSAGRVRTQTCAHSDWGTRGIAAGKRRTSGQRDPVVRFAGGKNRSINTFCPQEHFLVRVLP